MKLKNLEKAIKIHRENGIKLERLLRMLSHAKNSYHGDTAALIYISKMREKLLKGHL